MPSDDTCPVCSKPLVKDGEFCPFCGTRRSAFSTIAASHSYIQSQLNLALSKRLEDQKNVVREIADQAEDVIWKRLKLFGLLLTVIFGLTAFFGIRTVNDLSKRIELELTRF